MATICYANPIEQAKSYRRLMDENGWTTRRLAEELSIAQPAISHAVAMLKLPETIQAQVEAGAIPATVAYEISKIRDPEEQLELAEQVVSGQLRREDIRMRRKGKPRDCVKVKHGAHVVTISGPLDRAAVLAAIEEAIRQLSEQPGIAGPAAGTGARPEAAPRQVRRFR